MNPMIKLAMAVLALGMAAPAAAQNVTYYNDIQRIAASSQIWWSKTTGNDGPIAPVAARIKAIIFEDNCSMHISFDDSVSGIPFSSGVNLYFNNVDGLAMNGSMIEFQLKDPSFMRNWHWGIQVPAGYGKATFENLRWVFGICGVVLG